MLGKNKDNKHVLFVKAKDLQKRYVSSMGTVCPVLKSRTYLNVIDNNYTHVKIKGDDKLYRVVLNHQGIFYHYLTED